MPKTPVRAVSLSVVLGFAAGLVACEAEKSTRIDLNVTLSPSLIARPENDAVCRPPNAAARLPGDVSTLRVAAFRRFEAGTSRIWQWNCERDPTKPSDPRCVNAGDIAKTVVPQADPLVYVAEALSTPNLTTGVGEILARGVSNGVRWNGDALVNVNVMMGREALFNLVGDANGRPVVLPDPVLLEGHSATLLPAQGSALFGKVLIAGGARRPRVIESRAFLFNPVTHAYENASPMPAPRAWHEAVAADTAEPGSPSRVRVFFIGGIATAGGGVAGVAPVHVYDPAAGSWSQLSTPIPGRIQHTVTTLKDGRLLVVGGRNETGTLGDVWLINPRAGSAAKVSDLAKPRAEHTATLLNDGRVMIVGGAAFPGGAGVFDVQGALQPLQPNPQVVAEIEFISVTGDAATVTPGTHNKNASASPPALGTALAELSRVGHVAIHLSGNLADGTAVERVAIVGGANPISRSATPPDEHPQTILIIDPVGGPGVEDDGRLVGYKATDGTFDGASAEKACVGRAALRLFPNEPSNAGRRGMKAVTYRLRGGEPVHLLVGGWQAPNGAPFRNAALLSFNPNFADGDTPLPYCDTTTTRTYNQRGTSTPFPGTAAPPSGEAAATYLQTDRVRGHHTLTDLGDGRILVLGGYTGECTLAGPTTPGNRQCCAGATAEVFFIPSPNTFAVLNAPY